MTESTIQRAPHQKRFTILDNSMINDPNLSLQEIGLMTVILSKPDDWRVSIRGFASILKAGETQIKTTLKKLIENGYIKKTLDRENNGRIKAHRYIVYEVKQPSNNSSISEKKPRVENPLVENPLVENNPLLSTEELSTELTNFKRVSQPSADDALPQKKEPVPADNPKPIPKGIHPEAERLASFLLACILAHSPGFKKPNLKSWEKEIDTMMRLDNRSPKEVENIIKRATRDDFWHRNILSPRSLRKQYDRLVLQFKGNLRTIKEPLTRKDREKKQNEMEKRRKILNEGMIRNLLEDIDKNPSEEKEVTEFLKNQKITSKELEEIYVREGIGTAEKITGIILPILQIT